MFFVALEGIDASGKNTHSKLLAEYYKGRKWSLADSEPDYGYQVLTTSFPAYDSLTGKLILDHLQSKWSAQFDGKLSDDVIHGPRHNLDPFVFQCLQTVNRLECLPPEAWNRNSNTVLVSDRYNASAMVYGAMDGLEMVWLERINKALPRPDAYILLDIDLADSVKRRPERRDRYEKDMGYMERVRKGYLDLFQFKKNLDWYVVDGRGDVTSVHNSILRLVETIYPTYPR